MVGQAGHKTALTQSSGISDGKGTALQIGNVVAVRIIVDLPVDLCDGANSVCECDLDSDY